MIHTLGVLMDNTCASGMRVHTCTHAHTTTVSLGLGVFGHSFKGALNIIIELQRKINEFPQFDVNEKG